MSHPGTHITRIARGLSSVTSQIFRCHGLQHTSPEADRLGGHDIAYWLILLSVASAWFLFFFVPQHERLSMLDGRLQVLRSHCLAEKREFARLERSINQLARGDPHAWERAARGKLGWVEPGELTDLTNLAPRRVVPAGMDRTEQNSATPRVAPVLPRPAIPTIPLPAPNMRRSPLVAAPTDVLGPIVAAPPIPPRNYRPPQLVQADTRRQVPTAVPRVR